MDTNFSETTNGWMTIEELASASRMTVRNIRAHQSRGTLQKPHMKGRKGYYDSSHLKRLKQIADMQDRGYSLAAISDLLHKIDPEDVKVGVKDALESWQKEAPLQFPLEEFKETYPFLFKKKELIEKAQMAGIISIRDDQVEIPMPALAEVALSLNQHHADDSLLPFLKLAERTKKTLQPVAKDVVRTFVKDVLLKMKNTNQSLSIGEIVATFRPLGLAAISTLFSHAIEIEISALLENSSDLENRNAQ